MENVDPKYSVIFYKKKLDKETEKTIMDYIKQGIIVYLFININSEKIENNNLSFAIDNMFLTLTKITNDSLKKESKQ